MEHAPFTNDLLYRLKVAVFHGNLLLNTGIRMANGCVHLPYETLAMTGL
jgi:hypothetical protein